MSAIHSEPIGVQASKVLEIASVDVKSKPCSFSDIFALWRWIGCGHSKSGHLADGRRLALTDPSVSTSHDI
jgi:hypothetical protein